MAFLDDDRFDDGPVQTSDETMRWVNRHLLSLVRRRIPPPGGWPFTDETLKENLMPASPASVSTSAALPNTTATFYGTKKPKPKSKKKSKK